MPQQAAAKADLSNAPHQKQSENSITVMVGAISQMTDSISRLLEGRRAGPGTLSCLESTAGCNVKYPAGVSLAGDREPLGGPPESIGINYCVRRKKNRSVSGANCDLRNPPTSNLGADASY